MMKILMLVNWKVQSCSQAPPEKQPPDYTVKGEPYWFYRYFKEPVQVDVLDISSFPTFERFEREKLHFYLFQALRAIPRMKRYDLVVSHGMQSGVVVSLFRRFFPGRVKHVVFDIGSFNSAAESGGALRLMQFASHSIDGLIYHTGTQREYYERFFSWMIPRSRFIRFGTDSLFFQTETDVKIEQETPCILCIGYSKRDWDTLCRAYAGMAACLLTESFPGKAEQIGEIPSLRLIGKTDYRLPCDVTLPVGAKLEMIPYIPVRSLMEQIAGALFCVLPLQSFNYSFGQMTLLQQMAMGKAVITAKVPSMLDYVQDKRNAVFYKAGNSSELSEKMLLLFTDTAFRIRIGSQAADYVRREHNEKKMAEEIENFYRYILYEKADKQEK